MLTLRKVTWDDCELLWRWANDEEVRRCSFSQDTIPWSEHAAWLKAKLSDENCSMYIGLVDGAAVGQVRFDAVDERSSTVGVSVSAEMRSRGIGVLLLKEAVRAYFAKHPTTTVLAHIRRSNEKSLAAFKRAGFEYLRDYERDGENICLLALNPQLPK